MIYGERKEQSSMGESNLDKVMDAIESLSGQIQEMEQRFTDRLDEMEQRFKQRFDGINKELGEIKERLDDIEDVVRQSAHDILENQVEMVEKDNLLEAKITLLENNQLQLQKTVLQQGRDLEKLKRAQSE